MHTILIVEDNEDLAFGLSTNLRSEGYDVKIAQDGASGLKLARHYSLDLIILDLTLPKIDGIDGLKSPRKRMTSMHLNTTFKLVYRGTLETMCTF